jgi:hypothetical protein
MSIASVVETIGIEGEGIFSLKVTDAQISLEKHDRCQEMIRTMRLLHRTVKFARSHRSSPMVRITTMVLNRL